MKPVKLNLTKHCIHTEIKRLYNKTVSDYFIKKDADKNELEDKIELFKNALESFDFGKLRITCPELAGGGECDVCLEAGLNEQIIIKVNEISITGAYGSRIISSRVSLRSAPAKRGLRVR